MNETKVTTWILWAAILFGLVVAADYFFLHLLFKTDPVTQEVSEKETSNIEPTEVHSETKMDESFMEAHDPSTGPKPIEKEQLEDNFFVTLQKCASEIAAQTIATPEALLVYLQNSVGVKSEDIALENYHITLTDGSIRRVHVVAADNTNSQDAKEIRFFKLDEEGLPERIKLPKGATVKSLIEMGKLDKHEVRKSMIFTDGSSIDVETHNRKVFEFQYNNRGNVLSCRHSSCHCTL